MFMLIPSEEEGEVFVEARVWSSSLDLSSSEEGASLRGGGYTRFLPSSRFTELPEVFSGTRDGTGLIVHTRERVIF
ncbi:unnamed protein product [Lactuca virosa]|uniref:Uncharacterized protein n=1 Tax=Lactuca virosa TaxID=75947 RepID=A0AAU9NTL7_9ASTR|nr:unnamed protein product [Lactuca virosa]